MEKVITEICKVCGNEVQSSECTETKVVLPCSCGYTQTIEVKPDGLYYSNRFEFDIYLLPSPE